MISEEKDFNGKLDICFVGRLEKAKGVERLIKALSVLEDKSWIGTLYLIGDGPDRNIFEKQAKTILDIKVQFAGWLSREKLNGIYAKSHLFVLPSTASEGFPKVIAEAAAYGCVPVVSNVSSIGQYVRHNISGVVIENVSPENIANKFSWLSKERQLLKKMSRESMKLAALFTYERYNQRIEKEILLYKNV